MGWNWREWLRDLVTCATYAGMALLVCAMMARGQRWLAIAAGLPTGDARLWCALATDDCRELSLAVAEGADVNAADEFGQLPLVFAAGTGEAETVHELLRLGADPHASNNDGVSPLVAAVLRGEVRSVEYLLAAGADPLAASARGRSPLTMAIGIGDAEIAALLAAAAQARSG